MKLPLLLFLGALSSIEGKGSKSSSGSKRTRAGDPFFLPTRASRATSTDCLGVNDEGHACIDTLNRKRFFYTSEYQLEAEDDDGGRSGDCLEMKDDMPELRSCDRGERDQMWVFVRVPNDESDAEYMIMNMYSGKIIEYDDSSELHLDMGSMPRSSRASSRDLFVVNSWRFFEME
jgi:hypothetical protein